MLVELLILMQFEIVLKHFIFVIESKRFYVKVTCSDSFSRWVGEWVGYIIRKSIIVKTLYIEARDFFFLLND